MGPQVYKATPALDHARQVVATLAASGLPINATAVMRAAGCGERVAREVVSERQGVVEDVYLTAVVAWRVAAPRDRVGAWCRMTRAYLVWLDCGGDQEAEGVAEG